MKKPPCGGGGLAKAWIPVGCAEGGVVVVVLLISVRFVLFCEVLVVVPSVVEHFLNSLVAVEVIIHLSGEAAGVVVGSRCLKKV